jgi:signal transduction histidine kinase
MQGLLNVLRNSIEAIDINCPEKNIHISAFANSEKLVLQVKDSGNGFNESTASQLFNRGFTTKFSARGLGLHNCRSIMESHEGAVHISSPGQGKGAVATLEFEI